MNRNNKPLSIKGLSSPRNVVGDLSLTGRCKIKRFFPYVTNNTNKGDSRQKLSGMTTLFNSTAFTLIELLVVVLIIGILAAVAVPQYQKAVAKSKATGLLLNTNKLVDAQKLYFLANGTYATSLENLDIKIPYNCQRSDSGGPLILCNLPNGVAYFQWIEKDWRQCCVYENYDWKGAELCQALTGKFTPVPSNAQGAHCYLCQDNCPDFL